MKTNNIIQEKSFRFSVQITIFCREIKASQKESIISNQLLRSGTSVGANVEEGLGCQTRKDFYFRITIAYKEARESLYWLRVLHESSIGQSNKVIELISDCEELLRILGSILKTLRTSTPGLIKPNS
jgi:four helix bundle protein